MGGEREEKKKTLLKIKAKHFIMQNVDGAARNTRQKRKKNT